MKSTKHLEEIMKQHSMNINQLAKRTGTTASTFYSAFDRESEPTMDLILKVAYALRINPMDLLIEMDADEKMLDMIAFITTQETQNTEIEQLKNQLESMVNTLDYGSLKRFVQLAKVFLQLSAKEQRLIWKIADLYIEDWEKGETS